MKTRFLSQNTPTPSQASGAAPRFAALLFAAIALGTVVFQAGCTVVSYTGENGERFSRAALGARTAINSLAVETGTNGVRRIELRGYQNDASEALSTVTAAAVRAAIGQPQP